MRISRTARNVSKNSLGRFRSVKDAFADRIIHCGKEEVSYGNCVRGKLLSTVKAKMV